MVHRSSRGTGMIKHYLIILLIKTTVTKNKSWLKLVAWQKLEEKVMNLPYKPQIREIGILILDKI
jgi:hypothetical protein